jgi:hypothetical protein
VRVLERWSPDERLPLARALTKRFHPDATKTLGEPLSPQEEQLIASFDDARGIETNRMAELGLSRSSRPSRPQAFPRRGIRAILRKQIWSALEPILGRDFEGLGGGNWCYRTAIRRWMIDTYIDLGGRYCDLQYHHSVWSRSGPPIVVKADALGWLGLGGTSWNHLSPDEVPSTAATLALLCRRFVEAAPRLLPP